MMSLDNLPALFEDDLPVPWPAAGATGQRAPALYPDWRNWSCQRTVNGLALCPLTGTLWLATQGGVLGWEADGQTFTRYSSEHGLYGNSIGLVAVDGGGVVWAAGQGGLQQLADGQWQPVATPAAPAEQIGCFALDDAGALWFGTQNGVYAWDHQQRAVVHKFALESVTPPRALAVVNANEIWLCHALGLIRYQAGKPDRLYRQLTALALAVQGRRLWVGSVDGLAALDLDTAEITPIQSNVHGPATALLPLPDGSLAAALHNQLVRLTAAGELALLCEPLAQGRIVGLAADNQGGYWAATEHDLYRITATGQARTWTTRRPPDIIDSGVVAGNNLLEDQRRLSNLIQGLAVDNSGGRTLVWLATPDGLWGVEPNLPGGGETWQVHTLPQTQDIQSLLVDEDTHELWFTSWAMGVCRWAQAGRAQPMGGLAAPVLLLASGVRGARWAAALDGLYRSLGGAWERVLTSNQLLMESLITAIAQTQPDQLWLGTAVGLLLYHPIQDRLLLPKQNLNRKITALAYDASSAKLWAGTEIGLLELQAAGDGWDIAHEHTVQNSGLAADRITALALSQVDDNQMQLWVGTPSGLSCYSYSTGYYSLRRSTS